MIPRFKPNFNHKEIISLINSKKDNVKLFEEKFACLVNCKYAITFPSGRTGLYALLKSLKISGEVIIPAFNCIVVPASIVKSNCNPVFADISLDDYNIKTDNLDSLLSEKTNAVIPTHMYGYPANIKKIRDIIGNDVLIIEDAAQAILTKDVGKYGDASFYSFNFEKQLFTFGGGMVTTNKQDIYEKLIEFKNTYLLSNKFSNSFSKTLYLMHTKMIFSDILFYAFSRAWEANASKMWKKQNWDFNDEKTPLNEIYLEYDLKSNFHIVQGAVGLSQLEKINNDIKKRYEIAKIYTEKLEDIEKITLPPLTNNCSYTHYTIRVENRDKFEKFMRKKGIQINKVFEYSIPHVPYFSKYIDNKNKFSNSLTASKCNVNLPIYPQLLDRPQKISKIVNAISKYHN